MTFYLETALGIASGVSGGRIVVGAKTSCVENRVINTRFLWLFLLSRDSCVAVPSREKKPPTVVLYVCQRFLFSRLPHWSPECVEFFFARVYWLTVFSPGRRYTYTTSSRPAGGVCAHRVPIRTCFCWRSKLSFSRHSPPASCTRMWPKKCRRRRRLTWKL